VHQLVGEGAAPLRLRQPTRQPDPPPNLQTHDALRKPVPARHLDIIMMIAEYPPRVEEGFDDHAHGR
jgi:hypothetical protein